MSGIVSVVKPGWSGTVIGGFKEATIDRTLIDLGYDPNGRAIIMQKVSAQPRNITWTDRHDAAQIERATDGILAPEGQHSLISRLTTRQDAASELAGSMLLGSASLLAAGEPLLAIIGALLCGINAFAATKSLITGT